MFVALVQTNHTVEYAPVTIRIHIFTSTWLLDRLYVGGETESHLFYGYCPNRYCFHKEEIYHFHHLTNRASREALDRLVCKDTRTGVLCGKCRDGFSALYHSNSVLCSNSSDCRFGWLLYFISYYLLH